MYIFGGTGDSHMWSLDLGSNALRRAGMELRERERVAAAAAFTDEVTILDANTLRAEKWRRLAGLGEAINELGRRSAKAQGLRTPVTSFTNLATSDQRLYVYALDEQPRALGGLLKVGRKQLYHWDAQGNHRCARRELNPPAAAPRERTRPGVF